MRETRNYDELKKPPGKEPQQWVAPQNLRSSVDTSMPQEEWDGHVSILSGESRRDPHEGTQESLRDNNQQQVNEAQSYRDAKERKQIDETIHAMAQDNVQMLSRQTHDMRDLRSRFEAAGINPFEKKEDPLGKPERFGHEKARYEGALKKMASPYGNDPYGTENRATINEYAEFSTEQSDLEKKAAKAKSPSEEREWLDTKQIRGMEYVAYTSNRLAENAAIIRGTPDNPDTAFHRARANAMEVASDDKRKQFRSQHGEKVEEREAYRRSIESAENSRGDGRGSDGRTSGGTGNVQIAPTNGVAQWPRQPGSDTSRSPDDSDPSNNPTTPTRPTGNGGRGR